MLRIARALIVLCMAAGLALLTGGTVYASCGVGPEYDATRVGQLRSMALGTGTPSEVAFVGTVIAREAAFKRDGWVYTPVIFAVAVGIRGVQSRRQTVLTPGGTIGALTTSSSDARTYRSTGLNLVVANRAPGGSLLDAGACTLAGAVSVDDVRTLRRFAVAPVVFDARFQSTLPLTGTHTPLMAATGAGSVLIGVLLLLSAAPRRQEVPLPQALRASRR